MSKLDDRLEEIWAAQEYNEVTRDDLGDLIAVVEAAALCSEPSALTKTGGLIWMVCTLCGADLGMGGHIDECPWRALQVELKRLARC